MHARAARDAGHTDSVGSFFLRDNGGAGSWGLQSSGFDLAYDSCNEGGDLNNRQGAIFVR